MRGIAAIGLVCALGLSAGAGAADTAPAADMPAFELHNWDGRTIDNASFEGVTTIVAYTYAKCIIACPMLTFLLRELDRDLEHPPGVRYLHISVNPEDDSAEEILLHFGKHDLDPVADPRWLFVNGPAHGITRLLDEADIDVSFDYVKEGKLIEHTIQVLVVGPDGKTLATFDTYHWNDEEMRHALRHAIETD
jgi:cytochrome oxidase Cu insertion factor (SCO1/SenC/PrrC family)